MLVNKQIYNVGVNTSDATATQGDITSGKTAYIATGKVTGTLELLEAQNIRGSYDRDGLKSIGYTDADVDLYDGICSHYKSENNYLNLTSYDKSLYGVITENNTSSYSSKVRYCPYFNITKESFNGLFRNYYALYTIPQLNTGSVTNMQNMFYNCAALQTIPLLDTSNVWTMSNMFVYCFALQIMPQLNTSNVTDMTAMFSGDSALQIVSLLDASKVINIVNMFNNCYSLTIFGGLQNLGQAYLTSASANYSDYKLTLGQAFLLTEQSLINVLTNLYDIATKGCRTQSCTLGSTNLAKLTSTEGQAALAQAQSYGWTVS